MRISSPRWEIPDLVGNITLVCLALMQSSSTEEEEVGEKAKVVVHGGDNWQIDTGKSIFVTFFLAG